MKKKELIIFGAVILISISIAFIPHLNVNAKKETKNTNVIASPPSTVKVTIKGEIIYDSYTLEIPKGKSYGYVIQKISIILNEYSNVSGDYKQIINEDCEIIIPSFDRKALTEGDSVNGPININKASLKELITLYGIGEKRATKIIEARAIKKIASFEELKKIIGVSNEIIERIKEKAIL